MEFVIVDKQLQYQTHNASSNVINAIICHCFSVILSQIRRTLWIFDVKHVKVYSPCIHVRNVKRLLWLKILNRGKLTTVYVASKLRWLLAINVSLFCACRIERITSKLQLNAKIVKTHLSMDCVHHVNNASTLTKIKSCKT